MTEETKCEIIKAFAYGYTVEEVAELEEMPLEDAIVFEKANANEIEEKKAELREAGWTE
ncbi:MAG: hypothetical protein LUG45_01005 [Clostridiales bacterium]|nr:hypothetical protein [Clostridiales bacterium]